MVLGPRGPNPFWSDTAKAEYELRQSRPEDLDRYVPPSSAVSVQIEDGAVEESEGLATIQRHAGSQGGPRRASADDAEGQEGSRERRSSTSPGTRAILESRKVLLTQLVEQQNAHADRLSKLEDLTMQSAASNRSGHTSAREASQDPAKTTSIPDQRPLARQGQGSVGGVGVTEMREVAQWRGVENRAVANSPGARDASGCQHFYRGDRPRLLGGIKTEAFSGEPRMGGVDFGAPLNIEDLGGHQSLAGGAYWIWASADL